MKKSALFRLFPHHKSGYDLFRTGEQNMERLYTLKEVALMSGFTDRTLRSYLNQGLLKGSKEKGVWQFSAEDLEHFFQDPYVKEGLRIKHTGIVYDFLAGCRGKSGGTCVIMDIPADLKAQQKLSEFFCEQMSRASDAQFTLDWDGKTCRIILSGAEDQIARIMCEYETWKA